MRTKILLLYIVLIIGWPQIMGQTADCWGNFRGDSKLTGVSRATLPDQPAMLWNFNTQGSIMAAPVVCNGVVVVGTVKGALYGINADGTLKWKIITDNSIEAPALILNGVVYAGNLDGTLYAIDLKTGAIKWTYQTEKANF